MVGVGQAGNGRGRHPNTIATLKEKGLLGARKMRERREAGIAWAREWRRRNKPYFDALYGPDYRDAPGYGGWMQQEARGER